MRIAVIADIHGNLLALEAVLADLSRRGADVIVNLGDCVSGPLWPRETAARLRAEAWPTVRGNHDRWVAEMPLEQQGSSDACATREIDAGQRAWLGTLPPRLELATDILAFHATPARDTGYVAETLAGARLVTAPAEKIAARLAGVTQRLLLCGHSHLPHALRLADGGWLVNPGSVGCPAYHDPDPPAHSSESGSPLARYAIVDRDGERIGVDLIGVSYDHEAAARRAEANGRPEWAHALRTGYMPPG